MTSNIEKYIEDRKTYKSPETKTVQVRNKEELRHIQDLAKKYKILAIDIEHESKLPADNASKQQRKLIIKNFDENIGNEGVKNILRQEFEKFGTIDGKIDVVSKKEEKPAQAYLAFSKPEDAVKASMELNGREFPEIGATSLQVELKKFTPKPDDEKPKQVYLVICTVTDVPVLACL